jgi:hypothetical protein
MAGKSKPTKANAVSTAYEIPKRAIKELRKILEYNDGCPSQLQRVTREGVLLLLKDYGWVGSVHSLNRLMKAHFGRSLTGAKTNG